MKRTILILFILTLSGCSRHVRYKDFIYDVNGPQSIDFFEAKVVIDPNGRETHHVVFKKQNVNPVQDATDLVRAVGGLGVK